MLKFNLKSVTTEDLEKAKREAGQGNYTPYNGPIAPKGLYNAKVSGLWAGVTQAGEGKIVLALEINETGENAAYNGCPIWRHLVVPSSPQDKNFAIRMKSLDDLFRAASGGKININDFVDAVNSNRVKVGKEEKMGEPIEQIGKFKVENAKDIKVMLKDPETYNGTTRTNLHYIDTRDVERAASAEPEVDDSVDVDVDNDIDDIDDLLGELDD